MLASSTGSMPIPAWLWGWDPVATVTVGSVLALVVLALLIAGITRLVRGTRGAPPNVKLQVGNALVQAGVTWAVVTGVYAYCHDVLELGEWEAVAFAVFLEAAIWVTVGRIIAHGRATDDQGNRTTGFGPAGPYFWLFSILGGTLATIAGASLGAMVGRAVIVTFGTCLWYLTLRTYTRPSAAPSRFRWTPRRLLVAIGALEPADQDIADEHHEWQIRRLARAMRWANGRLPLRWLGQRALIARAEQTGEDVIEAARRRYAVAHLLVSTIHPGSVVMRRVLDVVETEVTGAGAELERRRAAITADQAALQHHQHLLLLAAAAQRAQLEQDRAQLGHAADAYRAQLEQERAALHADVERERAERRAERERAALTVARPRAIPTPTVAPAVVPSPAAGADANGAQVDDDPIAAIEQLDLLDRTAEFVAAARAARPPRPHGQRPLAAHLGVTRPVAAELLEALKAREAAEADTDTTEFPHVNGARIDPIPTSTGSTP